MPALSAIQDVDARDWVTGEAITPSKLERDFAKFKIAVNLILAYLRERELNFASSSEPNDINNGQLWYDLGNALLKIRRSGVWEQVLTESTATEADCTAGGGTDTFRLNGALNTDTTDISKSPGQTGDLTTYSLPASTLNEDGRVLENIAFITTDTGIATARSEFGGQNLGVFFIGAAGVTTHVLARTIVVRTASGSQNTVISVKHSKDNTGYTDMVNASTSSVNDQLDKNVNINLASNGSANVTQSAQLVLFG